MSARTENFGLGIAPWGSLRGQAAPEILGDEDRRVRNLTPGTRRVSPGRGETELSASRPPTTLPLLRTLAGFTEVLPQALFAQVSRPDLSHALPPSRLGGARSLVHTVRRPKPRRGFVFAGMRGCFVSPWGTRETRAAGRLPPLTATPASGHLLGLRPRATAFVLYISIKLPRISRLNNSTQKESA